jgi:hypothetical protein
MRRAIFAGPAIVEPRVCLTLTILLFYVVYFHPVLGLLLLNVVYVRPTWVLLLLNIVCVRPTLALSLLNILYAPQYWSFY